MRRATAASGDHLPAVLATRATIPSNRPLPPSDLLFFFFHLLPFAHRLSRPLQPPPAFQDSDRQLRPPFEVFAAAERIAIGPTEQRRVIAEGGKRRRGSPRWRFGDGRRGDSVVRRAGLVGLRRLLCLFKINDAFARKGSAFEVELTKANVFSFSRKKVCGNVATVLGGKRSSVQSVRSRSSFPFRRPK